MPFLHLIETYLFADWQFLKFLLVLIGLDTFLGMAWAWKKGVVSSRTFSRLLTKLLAYMGFLVLIHVLCHFTIEGVRSSLFAWLSSMAYGAILVREGISILENLVRLSPGTLPTWIVSRLKALDEQGKITDENTPNFQ
jgi:toxin secretion/phage lysis holin